MKRKTVNYFTGTVVFGKKLTRWNRPGIVHISVAVLSQRVDFRWRWPQGTHGTIPLHRMTVVVDEEYVADLDEIRPGKKFHVSGYVHAPKYKDLYAPLCLDRVRLVIDEFEAPLYVFD